MLCALPALRTQSRDAPGLTLLATFLPLLPQGGLWCWSQATCQMRSVNGPTQVSSTAWPDTMSQNGIFDTDETLNPFATANKVWVGYCSSDGARTEAGALFVFLFICCLRERVRGSSRTP